MKTIGYIDLCDKNKIIMAFKVNNNKLISLFNQTKNARILEAFKNIKNLGNIKVVYIYGNKIRTLFYKGL